VPVTAKLSSAFHERLGEDVANEIVEWFNQVDGTYRTDLNFARFDASLEQRVAELCAEVRQALGEVHVKLAVQESELVKWMFVFWTGTVIPLAGLILGLHLC
jgi:hypothetical protein